MKRPIPIRVLVAEDDAAVREALVALIAAERTLELAAAVEDATQAVEAATASDPTWPWSTSACRAVGRRPHAGSSGALPKRTWSPSRRSRTARPFWRSSRRASSVISSREAPSHRSSTPDRRRARENRIRRALEDDVLQMVFQPICDLRDRAPVGVEALARFRARPERGPERWFAEASEVGLRRELELAAAKAALAELPRVPAKVYLAVNVSPATLSSARFRKLFASTDAERVVVEVTEHVPVEDYEALNQVLSRLRSLGVRLAIDDAGAGFASLRHILRLAPDFVKLDRTLIEGIERDRSHRALAAGLITFAGKIDATIIAEGIERSAQLEALRGLGVMYGQGFLLARPAPLPLRKAATRKGTPPRSLAANDR